MKQKSTRMAYLAAVSFSLIIGLSFLFVKLIVHQMNPVDILVYRFLVAIIILTIPVLFGWIKLNINRKDIFRLLPLALFYPTLFFIFQTLGLIKATSAEGGIIQATAPIFILILASIFLKERTNIWQKSSLCLSVLGVIYIFIMQDSSTSTFHLPSILILIASVFSFAVYTIMARKLNQTYRIFDLTYIIILISMICFVLISFIQHTMMGTWTEMIKPIDQPVFWYSILYLGVLSTVVSVFLSFYALTKLEAYKMSVFSNLATLISIVAGIIFLDEKVTQAHWIGAIMIILGVVGTNLAGRAKKDSHLIPDNK